MINYYKVPTHAQRNNSNCIEKPEVDEKAGEHLEEDLDENGSGGSSEDEDEDKEGDVRM